MYLPKKIWKITKKWLKTKLKIKFTTKPFLGIMFYPSFFDRRYLINCNHNFLNEVIISFSRVIKILVVRKIYTTYSFLNISRVMLERGEFNLFVRASFNPRNCSCTKNELMVRQSNINYALLSNSLSLSLFLSLSLGSFLKYDQW